jgi:hypothetical protein
MKFLIQAIFLCAFGSIVLSIWEVIEWEKGLKVLGTCAVGLIFMRIMLTRSN